MNDSKDPTGPFIADCLERIAAGDENAARELLREMTPFVMKIVRSHLPPMESEHDLAQKIFIKMFQKLEQYNGRVPFPHWVSRIAVNTCLNQITSEKRRPELRWSDLTEEQTLVVETLASTEEELNASDSAASRDLVENLLSGLKPAQRLLMTLLYLEGRSVVEIRDLTGWSIPMIKIRAYRARASLRSSYERLTKEKR